MVLESWRRDGIRCSGYIDDLIFFASTWEEALALRTRVLADLEALGFQLNAAKVHLTPTQSVEFLGYILQSTPYTVLRVPQPKVDAVQAQARLLLSHARRHDHVSARSIASFSGRILSFRLASPVARLCTRGLLGCLLHCPLLPDRSGQASFHRRDYTGSVPISPTAYAELVFWAKRAPEWTAWEWRVDRSDFVLTTDASRHAWGGHLAATASPGTLLVSGSHPATSSGDSVETELRGLLRGLLQSADLLAPGTRIRLRTDSSTAFWVLRNGGSPSDRLTDFARRIWLTACILGLQLTVEYIGSEGIIRAGADTLSRPPMDEDLTLLPAALSRARQLVPDLAVDWFATASHRVSDAAGRPLRFCSILPQDALHPDCLGIDALAQPWTQPGLAFPPVHLVGDALLQALRAPAPTVLVLPAWPAQWWWPLLRHATSRVRLGRLADWTSAGPRFRASLADADPAWRHTWNILELELAVFRPRP